MVNGLHSRVRLGWVEYFPLPPPPLIEQVSYFNLSKPLLPHLQNGVNLIYLQSCGKDGPRGRVANENQTYSKL